MSVSVPVDEALLKEAERATAIHDWPALVNKGLKSLIEKSFGPSDVAFDFDRTLAAAMSLPDLTSAEFETLRREVNPPLPPAWSECE